MNSKIKNTLKHWPISLILIIQAILILCIYLDVYIVYYLYAFLFFFLVIIIIGIPFLYYSIYMVLNLFSKKNMIKIYLIGFIFSICLLSLTVFLNYFFIYKIQERRRFDPYRPKIQTVINQIDNYPENIKDVITTIYEPNYYKHKSIIYYFFKQTINYNLLILTNNVSDNRLNNISSKAAIELMRDRGNIDLHYKGMGEWHFLNWLWTYCLENNYNKNDILNLFIFYLPFNCEDHNINTAAESNFHKSLKDLNYKDIIHLLAETYYPINNAKRGFSDIIASYKQGEDRRKQLLREKYNNLLEIYNCNKSKMKVSIQPDKN